MPTNTQTARAASPDDDHSGSGTGHDLVPAEHLERNDDLCSSILVDQIGCEKLTEKRLGVHHQQARFVGPTIQPRDVLAVIRTVIKGGTVADAASKIAALPVMVDHIASKPDKKRRDDVMEHIGLYLKIYAPTSRLEIWRTDRYTKVSGHSELGVYATAMIPAGEMLYEIQGKCADIPDGWLGDQPDSDHDDDDEDGGLRRIRRSSRIGRRDFSIIRSNRSRKYQLFLGPARFINHDCDPNVELTSTGKNFVTFRARRRIMIGEELTTTYGDHYCNMRVIGANQQVDNNNASCMCATCEKKGTGYFQSQIPTPDSRPKSVGPSAVNSPGEDGTEEAATAADEDEDAENDNTPVEGRPYRPFRNARNNSKKLNFSKSHKSKFDREMDIPRRPPVDNPEVPRCITCVDDLHKGKGRFWSKEGYDDFCPRCTRHALIFKMPWPAHHKDQIKRSPPQHLVPENYDFKPVNSVPLPSLDPRSKKVAEPTEAEEYERHVRDIHLPAATKADRAHWALLKQWAAEDAAVEQQRAQQWEWQEDAEKIEEANRIRIRENKKRREEEKARKMKNMKRGSGLWARYEEVDYEEAKRKIEQRLNPNVRGTRSGKRFTIGDDSDENDPELLRRANEIMNRDVHHERRELEKKARRQQQARAIEEEEEEEEEAESEVDDDAGVAGADDAAPDGGAVSEVEAEVEAESPPAPANDSSEESEFVARDFPNFNNLYESRLRQSQSQPKQIRTGGTSLEPIDLTNTDDESDDAPRPHSISDIVEISSASQAARPARFSGHSSAKKPPSSAAASASQPKRRGPGRPPGSGRKQKQQAAKEARQAKLNFPVVDKHASSSSSGGSVDEASPPSAQHDDDESPDDSETESLLEATHKAGPSKGKRKRQQDQTDAARPKKAPRTFFKAKGIILPPVSVDDPGSSKKKYVGPS